MPKILLVAEASRQDAQTNAPFCEFAPKKPLKKENVFTKSLLIQASLRVEVCCSINLEVKMFLMATLTDA